MDSNSFKPGSIVHYHTDEAQYVALIVFVAEGGEITLTVFAHNGSTFAVSDVSSEALSAI